MMPEWEPFCAEWRGRAFGTMDPSQSALPVEAEQGYCFGNFRLDRDGTLRRADSVVHLPPRELAALRLLLAHAGQIVSPLKIKKEIWAGVHVTADSVLRCLSSLRARLGPEELIQTVYKRGYRFSTEVRRQHDPHQGAVQRIAIMPFTTGFAVPEHLGAAIAEEALARLSNAHFTAFAILARDSTFTLAQRGLTAQQLGQQLGADIVLTGSLSAISAQFRLRAEMIQVSDGTQIWVEDLLVPGDSIGGLEAELAERLVFRLGQDGLTIAAAAANNLPPLDPALRRSAHEIYLRGHHEWQSLQRHRMQDGLQHLLQAAELDPSLLSASIDIAQLCVTQAFYGFMSPAASASQVHRFAGSIPDVAHNAPPILPALGWVNLHFDRNMPAALQAFSDSAHLPHDPWTTRARSMFALSRHRFQEALALLRAALCIDPFSPWLHARLAWTHHLAEQRSESVDCIQRARSLFPEHEGVALYGSILLAFNGEVQTAHLLAESLARRSPHFDLATAAHAYTLACDGQEDKARGILERLQWLGRERFVLTAFNPAVHVVLGDMDSAIAELRNSELTRCPWFFQMLADPRLKPLRPHPEFQRMTGELARLEAQVKPEMLSLGWDSQGYPA